MQKSSIYLFIFCVTQEVNNTSIYFIFASFFGHTYKSSELHHIYLTSCSTSLRFTMKLVVFLFACLAFASSSPEQEWANFKLKFGKGYRSLAHEAERKAIFMTSLEKIETHNAKFDAGLTTYKQGINYYSDWTWEEFKDVILMEEQSSQRNHPKKASILAKEKPQTKFESSKDWTSIMGYVKNQGHCGSCWAFGAIGVMESAWYLGNFYFWF